MNYEFEWIRWHLHASQRLIDELNAQSALKTSTTQVIHFIASILMMIITAISTSIFAWKKLRILNVDSVKEKLFKKNSASNAKS